MPRSCPSRASPLANPAGEFGYRPSDADAGGVDRAIRLAQRALEVDPELDDVERTVIKLYTVAGAHAAAADQYEHYEAAQRDLGLDPPPFEDL